MARLYIHTIYNALRFNYYIYKTTYLHVIRVEFNSSSFQLTVIVWMGQVSDIVTAQPELVPEAVSYLKGLFCPKSKPLVAIAKCFLPFKKLWDMHFKNVCFDDYITVEESSVIFHELPDVKEVIVCRKISPHLITISLLIVQFFIQRHQTRGI